MVTLPQGEFVTYINSDITKPVVQPREWYRYPFHYDNVMAGMLTLFVVQVTSVRVICQTASSPDLRGVATNSLCIHRLIR